MGTYYYESNYPPYLAHYGVKGMKWGVRKYKDFRKGGVYRNTQRYQDHKISGYYDANKRYKRSKKALRAKRRKGQVTMDGYYFGEKRMKQTRRRAKYEVRRTGRDEYFSNVSVGRGIVGSTLLTVGGHKLYRGAKKKALDNAVSDNGRKFVAWTMAAGVGATMLGAGVTGGYMEVRRGTRAAKNKFARSAKARVDRRK